jgi:hypothetical protein
VRKRKAEDGGDATDQAHWRRRTTPSKEIFYADFDRRKSKEAQIRGSENYKMLINT